MKKILLALLISCICPVVLFSENAEKKRQTKAEDFITEYRFSSFQWIYPEYFLKADILRVEKEKTPPQGCTRIEFFGLAAYVPTKYAEEITRKHDIMIFKSKTGERIIMSKSSNSSMLCMENNQLMYQKDYCSAFKTVEEYNHKLFLLTPDTAETTGDKFIVHDKGQVFEKAKKIEVYSGDKFIAYVIFIKDSLVKEKKFSHEITLFHINGPLDSFVTMTFCENNDTLLNQFISSIE